ncbi:MAG: 2-dehydropantoate 2-reductase N-terminal domain-containing protein [Thermoanaerobaculia bacterium]
MRTLVYGAGPIGRWLSLRLHQAGKDVTLLARGETYELIRRDGVGLVDGYTGEKKVARVKLVERLEPEDRYDLVLVVMRKSSRLAVCPILAECQNLQNILFLGNDVSGFHRYLDYLPREKISLGFPGAGGGWDGDDLVIADGDKPNDKGSSLYIGELDGETRERTTRIQEFFDGAGFPVSLEKDIDGWLKYHFAFMGPTAGVVLMHAGNLEAVAADTAGLRMYIRACREAGDVLRAVGYKKRQPPIFNLYYWLPEWVGVRTFQRFFRSRKVEVAMGLHASEVGDELLEMMEEFTELRARTGIETPNLDELLSFARKPPLMDLDSRLE